MFLNYVQPAYLNDATQQMMAEMNVNRRYIAVFLTQTYKQHRVQIENNTDLSYCITQTRSLGLVEVASVQMIPEIRYSLIV